MKAMIGRPTTSIAGLAVSGFGWIVMAIAINNPGIGLDMVQLGTLFIGFCLLIGGLFMMMGAEQ